MHLGELELGLSASTLGEFRVADDVAEDLSGYPSLLDRIISLFVLSLSSQSTRDWLQSMESHPGFECRFLTVPVRTVRIPCALCGLG